MTRQLSTNLIGRRVTAKPEYHTQEDDNESEVVSRLKILRNLFGEDAEDDTTAVITGTFFDSDGTLVVLVELPTGGVRELTFGFIDLVPETNKEAPPSGHNLIRNAINELGEAGDIAESLKNLSHLGSIADALNALAALGEWARDSRLGRS